MCSFIINKTEIKGWNILIHEEVDTDISKQKLNNIHEETQRDNTKRILIRNILEGSPKSQERCPDSGKEFFTVCYELFMTDGLVLKEANRIIFPEKVR